MGSKETKNKSKSKSIIQRLWRRLRIDRLNAVCFIDSTPNYRVAYLAWQIGVKGLDMKERLVRCAVCLGDYEMNEKLQKLPVCGHAFHFECIDHWLANNTTCPLCRTSLLQAAKVVPLDSPAHVTILQQTRDFVSASSSQQVFPLHEGPDMLSVPASSSQQVFPLQEGPDMLSVPASSSQQVFPLHEGPDMLSIPVEENNRTISGRLSGESNLSSSDIHEGEIHVEVPQHDHTLVTADGAINAESRET